MSTQNDRARAVDPGLKALVTLLHFQGVATDPGQIRHQLGTDKIGAPEILRCAKDLGLKARAFRTDWSRLVKTPLPAIATLHDGSFLVVAKAAEDKLLVQSPQASRPALMTRGEFLAVWDGGLILMTRRAGLADITRRFDITWFLGAIHKYRHLLSLTLADSGGVSESIFHALPDMVRNFYTVSAWPGHERNLMMPDFAADRCDCVAEGQDRFRIPCGSSGLELSRFIEIVCPECYD